MSFFLIIYWEILWTRIYVVNMKDMRFATWTKWKALLIQIIPCKPQVPHLGRTTGAFRWRICFFSREAMVFFYVKTNEEVERKIKERNKEGKREKYRIALKWKLKFNLNSILNAIRRTIIKITWLNVNSCWAAWLKLLFQGPCYLLTSSIVPTHIPLRHQIVWTLQSE